MYIIRSLKPYSSSFSRSTSTLHVTLEHFDRAGARGDPRVAEQLQTTGHRSQSRLMSHQLHPPRPRDGGYVPATQVCPVPDGRSTWVAAPLFLLHRLHTLHFGHFVFTWRRDHHPGTERGTATTFQQRPVTSDRFRDPKFLKDLKIGHSNSGA